MFGFHRISGYVTSVFVASYKFFSCFYPISSRFLLQMIFRKVADVQREHELEERLKNAPPTEFAIDHPVRKLVSKFRKTHQTPAADYLDPERGKDEHLLFE